jgi:nucleoid-associated protein YgaU
MGLINDVRVRQPAKNDLVASEFTVAGNGGGFEGTIVIQVHTRGGKKLAEMSAQSDAGGIGVGEFRAKVKVANPPRPGTPVVLTVFGDDPSGGPGFNRRQVEVIMFGNMRGWLLYRVDAGDTLSGIVREVRPFVRTSVAQIVAANPRIEDPDVIQVGWRLRIPLR